MSTESSSGYKKTALAALKKADCQIGDIIRITSAGKTYEGILIPRSEYGDGEHIIIKLKNGYNIGIHITASTKIEKIGLGAKPSFETPSLPKQNKELPEALILSTGGTIASRVDYRTGAVRSALDASDLYGVVPELADIARVKTEIMFSLYSENITPSHWSQLAQKIAKEISEGVSGIVIPHGTDTMGYTAAALSFALQELPIPIILVGAQRSSDRPSSDAATNLIGAVMAATRAPFAEVALAMHEGFSDTSIMLSRGTKVRKCHTSRRDTFKPINALPLTRIKDQEIHMLTDDYRRRDPKRKLVLKPKFNEKIALIKFYPGLDPAVIDWYVEKGFRGIILEGTGLGHVSRYCFNSLSNAIKQDLVIGLASQCIWGRVNMNVYDTGRDLLSIGILPLEDMFPETALVKLMWVFGQTNDSEEAKRLLKTNISGEFEPRTLPEEAASTEDIP